ncbi:alpha/beta fold hydrolase [Spirosoma gilvum]
MKPTAIYKTTAGQQQVLAFYDSMLANWPLPYETQLVSTRHADTFVIACGPENAPALILLHGAASNSLSWRSEMKHYSKVFRVYAVDLPGEPGKSAHNRPSWHDQSYAEWLDDVLTGLAIQQVSLVGLSQGGWVALRFATSYPHRVENLVLVTPGGIVATKPGFILKAVLYSLFGRAGARAINRIVVGQQQLDATTLDFMDLILTHFKARVEKEYLFTDAELEQLTMPVLVIGGTADAIRSSEAITARLHQHVPHLQSILLPGVGHVVLNQSSLILSFLKTA